MQTRAAAVEATRERILSEAQRLFLERWYDDVTIALVAREAGVSGQTVLNHFGSKELLFAAVIERISGELQGRRNRAQPGDVAGAIAILVDDYEINGDATIRLLAVAERLPVVQRAMDMGRRGHREWVQRTFATPQRLAELIVVTDVYAWKLLRRDQRLNRDETVAAMQRMVEGVLADQPPDQRT